MRATCEQQLETSHEVFVEHPALPVGKLRVAASIVPKREVTEIVAKREVSERGTAQEDKSDSFMKGSGAKDVRGTRAGCERAARKIQPEHLKLTAFTSGSPEIAMKQRYTTWAPVIAAIATILGCADDLPATMPMGSPAGGGAVASTAAQVAEAGDGSAETAPAEPSQVNNCGTVENTDQTKGPGPFTPTIIQNGGPRGTSWVYYPKELGRNGCKHPIFNWGPGAGTGPANYRDHLNHLASHGFVIISQPSSGNGSTEKPALEWLMKQNDTSSSPFYQKLDTKKVVMGGHSMGALTTFAMADYAPLTHYVLVCGGSFGAPTGADKIHGPTIILGGDTDSGTPNFQDDYEAIKTPAIFLIKSRTDHIACARNNLEPWTAWMRWQLYGETKWKADFFAGGKYCKAPWNSCKSKNF